MTAGPFMGHLSLYCRVELIASPTTVASKGPHMVDDRWLNRMVILRYLADKMPCLNCSHSESLLKLIVGAHQFMRMYHQLSKNVRESLSRGSGAPSSGPPPPRDKLGGYTTGGPIGPTTWVNGGPLLTVGLGPTER